MTRAVHRQPKKQFVFIVAVGCALAATLSGGPGQGFFESFGVPVGPVPAGLFVRPAEAQSYDALREIDVHLSDSRTNQPRAYTRARVGGTWREVIGTTGRVPLSRRAAWVGPGGRLFVHARVPDRMQGADRDLDVYVQRDGVWELRGQMSYRAAGKALVSRTFIFPDLQPGPTRVEVHARGVLESDWQELLSGVVRVPKGGKLDLGWALDGADPRNSAPVEIALDVVRMPEDGKDQPKIAEVLRKRVAVSSTGEPWHRERIDLGRYAGASIRLRMRSRPAKATDKPSPGVVWGAPRISYALQREAFPVVALISFDSMRAQSMGIYGGPGDVTPFMDDFFDDEGVVFHNAFTQAVTTLPSHMTLMTSLNPCVHGVTNVRRSLAAGVKTLPALMREAGYKTVAFTEGGALAGAFGLERDFDVYDTGGAWGFTGSGEGHTALERAVAWLRRHNGEPVFLFIHTYRTRPMSFTTGGEEALRRGLTTYQKKLRQADADFRNFVGEFDRVSIDKSSFMAVTSGHGEEFLEHGAAGHGTHLYEESIRVPLMWRGGGIKKGRASVSTVGLIDVAPTILELVGQRPAPSMQGRSVASLLRGGKMPVMPHRFSEAHRQRRLQADGRLVAWTPTAISVREAGHKALRSSGKIAGADEAYDLVEDPRERDNVLADGEGPAWAQRLGRAVSNYPAICRRLAVRPGPAPALSAADRQKLRALGYAN